MFGWLFIFIVLFYAKVTVFVVVTSHFVIVTFSCLLIYFPSPHFPSPSLPSSDTTISLYYYTSSLFTKSQTLSYTKYLSILSSFVTDKSSTSKITCSKVKTCQQFLCIVARWSIGMTSFVKAVEICWHFVMIPIVFRYKVWYFISLYALVINPSYSSPQHASSSTNWSAISFLTINSIPYSTTIYNSHSVFSFAFVLIHFMTLTTLLVFINTLSIASIFIATLFIRLFY